MECLRAVAPVADLAEEVRGRAAADAVVGAVQLLEELEAVAEAVVRRADDAAPAEVVRERRGELAQHALVERFGTGSYSDFSAK